MPADNLIPAGAKVIRRGTQYRVEVDEVTQVVFIDRKRDAGFMVRYNCRGTWYYQWMSWGCRAGKRHYYLSMVKLYRYLRRNKITPLSLQRLASGDKSFRNDGYAILAPRCRA